MDPVSMLVGAAIAALGYLVRGLRKDRLKPVGPVCDCGHPLAFHNELTRRCHAETALRASDGKQRWASARCSCQRYVGPVPLESVWVPPILGEGKEG